MRNARDPIKVMLVTTPKSVDIRCDIDSLDGSFRGQLRNEDGTSRSFTGWTEFASVLMALARESSGIESKEPRIDGAAE